MKRLLIWALAIPLMGQGLQRSYTYSLNASGTTPIAYVEALNHTLQVNTVSASVCTVRLEGSLDGTNFADLSGTQTCTTSPTVFHVDDKAVSYIRINLLTFTSANPATIFYKGTEK